MSVIIIAGMTQEGVIGKGSDLPWHIPEDLKNFKRITAGHPCIMGEVTFKSIESMIGGRLPDRESIVLSYDMEPSDHVHVLQDVGEAVELGKTFDEEVFIIGGRSIYKQGLPFADKLYISWVDGEYEGDVYFPEVDWDEWKEVSREPMDGFEFTIYERR